MGVRADNLGHVSYYLPSTKAQNIQTHLIPVCWTALGLKEVKGERTVEIWGDGHVSNGSFIHSDLPFIH